MFSAKHLQTGILGEEMASQYLSGLGYSVIARNYRRPWGEIDIISKAPDKTLVFVEVKTLKQKKSLADNSNRLEPEDNLTQAKLRKLKRTCEKFANLNPEVIHDQKGWQIDLVAVTLISSPLLTKSDKNYVIKHYRNI